MSFTEINSPTLQHQIFTWPNNICIVFFWNQSTNQTQFSVQCLPKASLHCYHNKSLTQWVPMSPLALLFSSFSHYHLTFFCLCLRALNIVFFFSNKETLIFPGKFIFVSSGHKKLYQFFKKESHPKNYHHSYYLYLLVFFFIAKENLSLLINNLHCLFVKFLFH